MGTGTKTQMFDVAIYLGILAIIKTATLEIKQQIKSQFGYISNFYRNDI